MDHLPNAYNAFNWFGELENGKSKIIKPAQGSYEIYMIVAEDTWRVDFGDGSHWITLDSDNETTLVQFHFSKHYYGRLTNTSGNTKYFGFFAIKLRD